jgi:hypothetical protein
VKVALDGVEQMSGWSVNTSTGEITFTSAPGNGVAITAGCHFNLEVRFASDSTAASFDEHDQLTVAGGLEVVEPRDNVIVEDELYMGGSSTISLDADTDLTPQMGRLVRVTPSGAGLALILPSFTGWEKGGPYWKIRNLSGANTIALKYAGSTVATVQVAGDAQRRDMVEVWLADIGAGAGSWEVFA